MKFLKHFIVWVLCSIPLIPAFSFAQQDTTLPDELNNCLSCSDWEFSCSEVIEGCTFEANNVILWCTRNCDRLPTYWQYVLSCVQSNNCTFQDTSSDSNSSTIITSEQVNSIGSAVVQGWTSLVWIWIQLLPYLICFVIILIIFLVIKRISNLKNKPL